MRKLESEEGPRLVAEPFSRRWSLLAPAVNDARRDSSVVLVRAAKLRVQVFCLYQTNGDMVGHLVIGAAAEGHREGTIRSGAKTGGADTDVLPSEQDLCEWR